MNMGGGAAGQAVSETLTICNEKGLHARAAAKFVNCAGSWSADITVSKGGASVGGTSIMGLLMLAASKGCQIEVSAVGADAAAAVAALKELVDGRFEEER